MSMTRTQPTSSADLSHPVAKASTMRALDPDHSQAWNRELLALGGGALAAGLVASGLQLIAGAGSGMEMAVLSFGAILGLGANLSDAREGSSTLRLVLGVGAGVLMAVLSPQPVLAGAVGGLGLGAAFALHHGGSAAERGLSWLAYAGALAAAMFTTGQLVGVGRPLASVPPLFGMMLMTSIWGVFLMFASGVKHLDWERDEVIEAYGQARGVVDVPGRRDLDAGREAYERVLREIARDRSPGVQARSREIASEVSAALIALVKRASELRAAVARTPLEPLERRAGELESRIRSSRDRALRRELTAALAEIVEQIRTRRRLEAACVRLEARQQRMLTALERLHVTLVQDDALSAHDDGAVGVALDELERLTEEVTLSSLSLDELVAPDDDLDGDDDDADEALLNALLREARGLDTPDVALAGATSPAVAAADEVDEMDEMDEMDEKVVLSISATPHADEVVLGVSDEAAPDGADGSLVAEAAEVAASQKR